MYGLAIDRSSPLSIVRQLTVQLRAMILDGTLSAGMRLPPTRNLAAELSVARNTVLQVYEQLTAEGYLSGRTGSGTYVMALSDDRQMMTRSEQIQDAVYKSENLKSADIVAFETGLTDYRHFPRAAWARAMRDALNDMEEERFAWGDVFGENKLRKELCAYLYRTKDITCSPEQVAILPGATSGVDMACWALKNCPVAVVEDPCVHFMRRVFERNGYNITPVPVDRQGMSTKHLADIKEFGLAYTVPSHQFPTGNVLPIQRRLELLYHARRCGAYILEDDYDSEFRYEGEPIQTLRHLDPDRVIYLGSFSKIFSPTLRMGYMILPWGILDRIRTSMESLNLSVPVVLQFALASFMKNGQLERHIYKMKRLYARKRLLLIRELTHAFGDTILISGENAGMHVMVSFEGRKLCRDDFNRLLACGVEAEWSKDYAMKKEDENGGMILGYGALTEEEIKKGVVRIHDAIG